MKQFEDIALEHHDHVTVVEIQRPPYNFFDTVMIACLADALEYLDTQDNCRAIVLAAQGQAFCAGADFNRGSGLALFGQGSQGTADKLYQQALRLFATRKPIVGAIHGPAVGGGLGLALVPDFRVVGEQTRFSANFVKLGVHAGFGITYVLPRLIGVQKASLLLYTGRRIHGREALEIGLADVFADDDQVRQQAMAMAAEIAEAAPLAVESTRATLRHGLVAGIRQQIEREFGEQMRLVATQDHQEGKRAVAERRAGVFTRR